MGLTLDSTDFRSTLTFDDTRSLVLQHGEPSGSRCLISEIPEPLFGSAESVPQPSQAAPEPPPPPQTAPLDSGAVTLFALDLDRATLSDSMATYGDAADPLLPVSEIARLLDLDIEVLPQQHAIHGRIGESRRALTVDLDSSVARIGAVEVPLGQGSAKVTPTEIYIKSSVLERLLPLKIQVDTDDYRVTLIATEKLPVQSRAERRQRIYNLGDAPLQDGEAVLKVDSPYRQVSYPAFDINTEIGTDTVRGGFTSRFEGRVAADLLKTDFTGYFSTDDQGRPASARLQFQRRDATGGLLGPLHATYLAAGDVYTPSLVIGPRSYGGAGVALSNARIDETSVFQHISLRGELPVGYDVELYVNDVLYGGQTTPIIGRYEFADVPLVRGTNVIRVVTYGPHGEREERTRVINVGGGQLASGQTVFEAGIVRQDSPVIEFPNGQLVDSGEAKGDIRFVANIAHGLTPSLTIAGGVGLFSDHVGKSHSVVTAGLRGSLLGTSVQADYAQDLNGSSALLLGAAGRVGGVSFIARHSEYGGAFVDETATAFDIARPMVRHSQMLLDFSVPFFARQRLPFSGNFERTEFADGGVTWSARGRTTLSVANTLVALGGDYAKRTGPGFSDERLTGSVVISRLVDYKWQLRASADYGVLPNAKLQTVSFTVDRDIAKDVGFRFGVGESFDSGRQTSVQARIFARLPFGEASLGGDYSTDMRRWRVGLQLRFGFARDPYRGGYRMTPPGPASGGSVAIQAFTDNNGDNRMGPEDTPLPGIKILGGGHTITTDEHGWAFVTDLGDGQQAIVRTDTSAVDTVFTASPPQVISVTPRAGDVIKLPYPFFPTAEVDVHLTYRREDGASVGLSAVRIKLVPESGESLASATEFDGTAVYESVRPGHYRLELDPEQVQRLGITLAAPVEVFVESKGGRIVVNGEIVIKQLRAQ